MILKLDIINQLQLLNGVLEIGNSHIIQNDYYFSKNNDLSEIIGSSVFTTLICGSLSIPIFAYGIYQDIHKDKIIEEKIKNDNKICLCGEMRDEKLKD